MFLAIIFPFPVGMAANGDNVCDSKLRWCGDKGGMPEAKAAAAAAAAAAEAVTGKWWGWWWWFPRFTGRPNWLANKGTELLLTALMLVDGECGTEWGCGGTLGRGIEPNGAAPGGRSLATIDRAAPTGGLLGGAEGLLFTFSLALLLRSLLWSLSWVVIDEAVVGPLLLVEAVFVTFISFFHCNRNIKIHTCGFLDKLAIMNT